MCVVLFLGSKIEAATDGLKSHPFSVHFFD